MDRSYRALDGERTEIRPPRETAMRLHEAHRDLVSAQAAYDAAYAAVPSYTGGSDAIDHYGREEESLNRAIDAFEDAVVASAGARAAGDPVPT